MRETGPNGGMSKGEEINVPIRSGWIIVGGTISWRPY